VVQWLTVEVFSQSGEPAAGWLRSWHDTLVETALAAGADYWDSHEHAWGVVLELAFADENARDRYREHPALRAALDAAPDPVNGVLVYPHRGGGSGALQPRRPRPQLDSGVAELPLPDHEPVHDAISHLTHDPDLPRTRLTTPSTSSPATHHHLLTHRPDTQWDLTIQDAAVAPAA
jgi:hypothetical protein